MDRIFLNQKTGEMILSVENGMMREEGDWFQVGSFDMQKAVITARTRFKIIELNEPLFVKKNWVPQWLWNLISEPRLSYFDHEKQSRPTAEAQVANAKVPTDIGPWSTYNFEFNKGVNDPAHLKDVSKLDLPSPEWFAQAFHDVICPIEEVGMDFRTFRERHPRGLSRVVSKETVAKAIEHLKTPEGAAEFKTQDELSRIKFPDTTGQ